MDSEKIAIARLKQFVSALESKPIRGIDDEFYSVHTGTEWEASLRLSDLRIISRALEQREAVVVGGPMQYKFASRVDHGNGIVTDTFTLQPTGATPPRDVPEVVKDAWWAVGRFRSSPEPNRAVLKLSVGSEIESDEQHHSFIEWVYAHPAAAPRPDKENGHD